MNHLRQHTPEGRDEARRPLVSVIMPARNAASTIEASLASVLLQDCEDWELIVINDGSTDETREIVDILARRDNRVRCIDGRSRGVSAARNLGVRHAQAALVAFLDADDVWLADKLSAHLAHFARDSRLGLSFDRIAFADGEGQPTGVESTRHVRGLEVGEFLAENPACTASTVVLRRELFNQVGGFDEGMRFAEDLELIVRIRACTRYRVEGLRQIHTVYRASTSGASSDLAAMQAGWEALIDKVRTYAPGLVAARYRSAKAIHLRYLARRCVRLGLPSRSGMALFAAAVASSPLALLKQPRRTLGTLALLLITLLLPRPIRAWRAM